ncbi:putative bifunctional diguanylate cyclase/phosphodiesterase [Roseateles violae]|uniref:EAL domain-containing protein n=1 Tax=Roseateles violae TaxID=3058042 RepID=A0ABT8DZC7_9BURK|nr:EAL domain-containing protein [Pelomonas sp. PFR6]MDN3922951.1 EAL domain-containing protein [Pelomonas sp. PFR6]
MADRRVGWILVASVGLLLSSGLYLLAQQRDSIQRNAAASALDVARGLEASISARLLQSVASLRGMVADLADDPGPAERIEQVLRTASRYDPLSAWLGWTDEQGRVLMVDRAGARASPAQEKALAALLEQPPAQGVGLQPLIQMPGEEQWLMPLSLRVDARSQVFALVRAARFADGAESLKLLPDSRVALVAADGRRLLRFGNAGGRLEANGPPLSPERMGELRTRSSGTLRFDSALYPGQQLAGYVQSASLPLYVAVVLPESALDALWLRDLIGPGLVLLIGLGGIVVFAVLLRGALRKQQQALERQRYLAEHDALTGLLNRDTFWRRLAEMIDRSGGRRVGVVLFDLDNFKAINETLGHVVGDQVLVEIGRRLQQLAASQGLLVARVGGDEWSVAAGDVEDRASVERLLARLDADLGQGLRVDELELELSSTMGIALCPDDAQNALDLLRRADIALHAAKDEMKRVVRYEPAMDQFSAEALALRSEFARALREDALEQVYQPKVRLSDGALVGVEALARWTHPQRGPIPPARFVPLAENSELIHAFSRAMLGLALAQAARWRDAGHRVPVAVNISANNLLDAGFVEMLRALLEQHRLAPDLLELEVTESAVMRHADLALRRLQALRELGIKLSIDDFGTGYASLSYLKRLPVQALKIDQVFVREVERDDADQRIVRSSIQLAHGFGMVVVAEGVETQAAADLLQAYGCDFAQGYHYARPLPAAEVEAKWLSGASAAA